MNEKTDESSDELRVIIAQLEKSEMQLKATNQQLEAINLDLIASEKSAVRREEKYRLLAENISDVIWVYNINSKSFTYISPSVFQLRGYTVDEAMSQSFTESLIFEHADKINKLFISRFAVLKKGITKTYSNELQQLCKDGSTVWVEIVTTPQIAKNGSYEILGVSRNIDDRRKIENKQQLTNEQLVISEQQLKATNQQLEANNQQLLASEQKIQIYAHNLGERVKELNCLYVISESIRNHDSLDDILTDVINIIPPSWQYPEITCAKLTLNEKEYKTSNYKNSKWKMNSDIIVNKISVGNIKVGYLVKSPSSDIGPFLKEEQILLDNITERIGRVVERQKSERELSAINQQLDASNQQLLATEQQLTTNNKKLEKINNQLLINTNILKISEERYKGILNNALNCVAVYKPIDNGNNFVFIDFNKAAEKLENIKREDIIGKKITDVFPAVKEFGILDVFKNVLKTGKPEHFPITFYEDSKRQGYRDNYIFSLSTGEVIAVYQDVTESKKLQIEIAKLSTAVEQSPSIIAISDLVGNIEYVNSKFTELTGYTKDEVLNNNLRILKSGEHSKEYYSKLWNTIMAGKTWHGEFHNRKKNGELFWEASTISPIFDKNGVIINYLKVAEDITIRKKAEDKLKASEDKYRELIDTTSEGFWLLDSKNTTIDINASLGSMLNYSKGEIVGKNPIDFTDKENKNIFIEQLLKAKEIRHQTYDICLKNKSGKNIPTLFNATSLIGKNGEYNGLFAFVTNISKRKYNERIRDILYHISNAVNTTNSVEELINQIQNELGKIIDTTNFYVALYDSKTDMLSLPYYADEKDSFSYAPAAKTLSKYVIETKKPLLANHKLKEKFVKEGILEHQGSLSKLWLGVPLKIGGKVTGIFALQSYTDENAFSKDDMKMLEFVSEQISISIERKKNEHDLNTALYNATESDRLKSAFLATISHELRTPLNAIIGFAGLINKELDIDDILEFANTIKLSGNNLLNIVSEIFDITLIESGKSIISKREVNLNETLKNIYSTIKAEQSILNKDNIDLNIIIPPEASTLIVNTDPFKIKQILTNLLKNALKFTNTGHVYYGYITEVIKNQSVVKFFVKDTGIGIPKDKQEYIFGIFKQIDDTYTRTYGGLGIGLSISKKLTELLGGNIWFKSEEGIGSTFYFTIPNVTSDKPAKNVDKPSSIKINLSDKTILIVEDDIDSFEFLKVVLKQMNAKIIWARNGAESIDICKLNSNIDLILMDINMQVMNGYDATIEIKKIRPNLPIIAQTALAIVGDREKAYDAGCDDYITKPISKNKLMIMIKNHLTSK